MPESGFKDPLGWNPLWGTDLVQKWRSNRLLRKINWDPSEYITRLRMQISQYITCWNFFKYQFWISKCLSDIFLTIQGTWYMFVSLKKSNNQQASVYYSYLKRVWKTSFFDWVWLRLFLILHLILPELHLDHIKDRSLMFGISKSKKSKQYSNEYLLHHPEDDQYEFSHLACGSKTMTNASKSSNN